MLICVECKKEMTCIKNGVNARWNGTHTYPGDLFQCTSCGTKILNTGNCNAYENKNHNENDLYMTESYEFYIQQKKNQKPGINLRD